MDKKRLMAPLRKNDLPYKALIIFAIIVSFCYRLYWIAAVLLVLFIGILTFDVIYNRRGIKHIMTYLEGFASKVKGVAADDISGFPFPVAVLSLKGKILWYNRRMDKIFGGEFLFQKDITSIVRDFDMDSLSESGQYAPCKTKVRDSYYEVFAHRVLDKNGENENIFVYFTDSTPYETLKGEFANQRAVVALIAFDNYEEVMQGVDEEQGARIISSVDKILTSLCGEVSGILRKLDKDKYLMLMRREALDLMINRKFDLLDAVREIPTSSGMPPTFSIGIGTDGDTLSQLDSFSRAAMDMALGRGGDQVVIKDKNTFSYFGGKTKAIEKRTRVKARVVALALRELMAQSDNIVIIGHKNADIDCVGAAIGLVAAARARNDKINIVLGESDETVRTTIAKLIKIPSYSDIFIKPDTAREIITPKTLLIVTDTHKLSYTESNSLLSMTDQIAVIDHHRRDSDFIEKATLLYHEPYASSASEMVTEMLQYMPETVTLLAAEAEAMYAGIYLDTKGFTFKTGVRTLEAAAYLRRSGVDTVAVKKLFQSDFETYMQRTELVTNAYIHKEHIAISALNQQRSQFIVAQAADDLLNIVGIDCSFVLASDGNSTIISGRSTGAVNVQMVLEKLGGGGHMAVAGAQLQNTSTEAAENMLLGAIDEYFSQQ